MVLLSLFNFSIYHIIKFLVKNFNAPHRTGLVVFPHPALQFSSQVT